MAGDDWLAGPPLRTVAGSCNYYRKKEHGSIEEYLALPQWKFFSRDPFPTFRGYQDYEKLWKLEFMVSGLTVVRFMFGFGPDYHFGAKSPTVLVGIEAGYHSGHPGEFNAKSVFRKFDVAYEVQRMNIEKSPAATQRNG